jgi:hypothetical protein
MAALTAAPAIITRAGEVGLPVIRTRPIAASGAPPPIRDEAAASNTLAMPAPLTCKHSDQQRTAYINYVLCIIIAIISIIISNNNRLHPIR